MGRTVSDHVLHQVVPAKPSKSQRRRIQIIEAAMKLYVREGIEEASFEKIATACDISRPLVQHYFADRDELFFAVARFVRASSTEFALKRVAGHTKGLTQLTSYIRAVFEWVATHPDHAKVWVLFCYYCSIRDNYRKAHTEVSNASRDKIAAMIALGNREETLSCRDPAKAAHLIFSFIYGTLITTMTEDSRERQKDLENETFQICLELAGKPPRP